MVEHTGSVFCHHLVAANKAMKNMKIKIHCSLKWLPKDKFACDNQPKTNGFDGGEMG
jgi:hypothetical protein